MPDQMPNDAEWNTGICVKKKSEKISDVVERQITCLTGLYVRYIARSNVRPNIKIYFSQDASVSYDAR
jgi:hypothetical protein